VAGACACPIGQLDCSGLCADTLTNTEHCGACEHACNAGEACVAGTCSCPAGQTSCAGTCIDTQTSLEHCGGCDQACFDGESCTAGACRGAAGADGCSGSARLISLDEIAVYQSVKIPIMQGLTAIASEARGTDVVTGRETLFRIFVTPQAGFAARELSARLTLINGAGQDQYFAKQTISGASSDASSASTFMIFVPPDKIQADTRYAVELVECGSDPGAGAVSAPRFPDSGDEPLGARDTGTLKIAVVPVQVGSYAPDTSDAALGVYRDYFMAMYPISSLELTVTSSITTSSPINWNNLLEQIRQKRQSDAPAGDVYYYGFVKPAATFRDYCQSGCTAGVGYVGSSSQSSTRVAVGLAFADQASASTMAHEVGHNHGRNHAPCAPGGQISGIDNSYPHSGATLGSWGYDARTRVLLDPDDSTDIMGYCNMKWVSDYTYDALITRVATVNANYDQFVAPESLASYRVLLLDADGPRWSFPITQPSQAFGEPLQADVLAADGSVASRITVFRTEIGDALGSWIVLVPESAAGGVALRVRGWPAISFAEALGVPSR
jgi:Peptidase M66/Stigma-specific protein, Stig1